MIRRLPARDRPGWRSWLGPTALTLGLLSWLVPFGELVGVLAATAGTTSVLTDREYRVDATAIAGIGIAGTGLFFSLLLLAMTLSGH